MELSKLPKARRVGYFWMADVMRRLEHDLHHRVDLTGQVPKLWEQVARERGPQPKVRISLWVERDVVRVFKSMGAGYQTRMNDVLRLWVQARIAGVIRSVEQAEMFDRSAGRDPRPQWGEAETDMEEVFGDRAEEANEAYGWATGIEAVAARARAGWEE
jgi:uncharacterized protein (DUF4415 family)